MKFIFLCLLIVNALFVAMWQGYIASPFVGSSFTEAHQPQRLSQQQNSDRLKIISSDVANTPLNTSPPSETLSCLEWGIFSANELAKVEAKLKPFEFGSRLSRHAVNEATKYIVYIPSLGSKESAEKKAAELKALGVDDFFIIQEPSNNLRWGISLGVFKSEELAKHLLTALTNKGVHSAKMEARTVATNKFNLVLNDVSSSEKAGLDNLRSEFSTQDLRACQ